MLITFIKSRGAGRHTPIGLMIDELASLFSTQTLAGEIFAFSQTVLFRLGEWLRGSEAGLQ